jgi:outer membrane lipoprotein-sorting protein
MRRFVITVLASFCFLGCAEQGAPDPAAKAGAELSSSETADSLIKKHIAALGGYDRLKSARTMQYAGKTYDGDKVTTFAVYRERPNKFRKEGQKDGKPIVKVFDGAAGWVLDESGKVNAIAADKLAGMKSHAEFDDAVLDYEKRGHKVELAGVEEVNGKRAYKIRLTVAGGDVETRYIDAVSYFEVKRTFSGTHEGKPFEKSIYFSDYRPVNGIQTNHVIELTEKDGKKVRSVIETMSYDAPIDAALFRAPQPSGA